MKLRKIVELLSKINQTSKAKNLIDQCKTSSWLDHQNKWINDRVELHDREIYFVDEWSSNSFKSWESCFCFCREFHFQSFCFQCNKTCTIRRLNFANFLDFSWRLTIYVIFEWWRRWWTWRFKKNDFVIFQSRRLTKLNELTIVEISHRIFTLNKSIVELTIHEISRCFIQKRVFVIFAIFHRDVARARKSKTFKR